MVMPGTHCAARYKIYINFLCITDPDPKHCLCKEKLYLENIFALCDIIIIMPWNKILSFFLQERCSPGSAKSVENVQKPGQMDEKVFDNSKSQLVFTVIGKISGKQSS